MAIDDYKLGIPDNSPMANMYAGRNTIADSRVFVEPASPFQKGAASIAAGLGASNIGGDTYDGTDVAVQVGSATAEGALAGAATGGPVGALIGGGAALLSSGISAWSNLRANKRRRNALEQIRQEKVKQEAMLAADNFRQGAEAKKLSALQNASAAYDKNSQWLIGQVMTNQDLKNIYVQRGWL